MLYDLLYPFHTRLSVLRIYPRSDQKTAIQFFDCLASRLPFAIERAPEVFGACCAMPTL